MKVRWFSLMQALRIARKRWAVYLLMITGLTLALSTAVVIGIYVRDELTFERFIPGASKVYMLTARYGPKGMPLVSSDKTPAGMARWMVQDMPEVEGVTRLLGEEWPMWTSRASVNQRLYSADPNFFSVVKLPVAFGDASSALERPGSVVITRRVARAYFGRDDVVGMSLNTRDGVQLRVTAVLKDYPSNTQFDREVFVSSASSYSYLGIIDQNPEALWAVTYTYLILKPNAAPSRIQSQLQPMSLRHWRGTSNLPVGYDLVPLVNVRFQQPGDGALKPRGRIDTLLVLGVVAISILALATINFSGLILAERNERSLELALRAALGGTPKDIVVQTLLEALSVYAISLLVAFAALERLLPYLNEFLDLELQLWTYPVEVLGVAALGTLLFAVIGGLPPALLLGRSVQIREGVKRSGGANRLSFPWQGWVIAQLALVVMLLITSYTMSRQWRFATHEALGFNSEDVMMVRLLNDEAMNRFEQDLRRLPGVIAVSSSFGVPTVEYSRPAWIRRDHGELVPLVRNNVSPGFFNVYRIPMLAGRDLTTTFTSPETASEIVINEAAASLFGFPNAESAIGKSIAYETDAFKARSRIVGVVGNTRFATVYQPVTPMIYDGFSRYFTQLNVRLDPTRFRSTTAAIDALWLNDMPARRPISRTWYVDYLAEQYRPMALQMNLSRVVSSVAIALSALGLTGFSVLLKRHATRDIAIHRALGANIFDVVWLRTRPFVLPIIIANVIGWILAWIVMKTWLSSFADHVPIAAFSFVLSSLITVAFSAVTVIIHAVATSLYTPVEALRHK